MSAMPRRAGAVRGRAGVALVVACLAPASGARAASPLSEWFEGLKVPGTVASCCGVSDCHEAVARMSGDHYEVVIDGYWARVPDHAIVRRAINPTGEPVVCYSRVKIYCFVPGPGT